MSGVKGGLLLYSRTNDSVLSAESWRSYAVRQNADKETRKMTVILSHFLHASASYNAEGMYSALFATYSALCELIRRGNLATAAGILSGCLAYELIPNGRFLDVCVIKHLQPVAFSDL